MTVYETARIHMVESQLRPNKVTDERLIDAFLRINREMFVPEALRGVAYIDDDLPLGHGRYLMQPLVAARLLQALAIDPKDTALVVGAGVGYEAAVLSLLLRSVVAVEEDAELARIGRSALVDHRIASVTYAESAPGLGHRPRSPYNVILFSGAVEELPSEISAQLGDGGRISVVLRPRGSVGRATVIARAGGVLARRIIFDAAMPLLPGFAPKPGFVF
ncbi:MAG TPA: protein-L-isoaspartate O-methyltransferase [Stellaceae bacterium]|jgi:protein-L-isoaspartate(D-aspartate) O-methyltransferase|nr:protein-L-isoaspartate O-methyltransferase [Stellaceae bacterium]